MQRASILSALAVIAGFATFWADTIVDTLLRGFIARLAAGLIIAPGRQQPTAAT